VETVSRYPLSRLTLRNWSLSTILLFILTAFSPALIASEARAEFRVCNGTQNLVGVAIGYRAKEGWITEGWWQVPATTCATLIEGELQSR
jgi:uncharacterized membrane protein